MSTVLPPTTPPPGPSVLDDLSLLDRAQQEELENRLRTDDLKKWGPRSRIACRFCQRDNEPGDAMSEAMGATVCACRREFGYAHRTCYHLHLFETREPRCRECRQPWQADEFTVLRIIGAGKRVRLHNMGTQTARATLLLGVLFAAVLALAFLVKGVVWVASGAAVYPVFDVPILAVEPAPCLGDLVVGTITLVTLVAALSVLFVVRKRCCGHFRRYGARYDELSDLDDAVEMTPYGGMTLEEARAHADATLDSSAAQQKRSRDLLTQNSVRLTMIPDEDSDSLVDNLSFSDTDRDGHSS